MPGIPTENGTGPHVNAHPEFMRWRRADSTRDEMVPHTNNVRLVSRCSPAPFTAHCYVN
jgi:hypothetical protein